jgi:predicted alpha/beta hydrolase
MPTDVGVMAADGTVLQAVEFRPSEPVRASVVVAGAMGVEQRFYAAFAAWLSGQGFLVMTFDVRGVGRSLQTSLQACRADATAWAVQDCAAMIRYARQRADGVPLLWLGHSLGGQVFGMIPNRHEVRAMLTVACGSGYWLTNRPELLLKQVLLWYLVVPLSVRLLGYFPGRRLRIVGDVPGPAMMQWRRWCLHPDYVAGAEGLMADYAAVQQPICGLAFTDDELMSGRNIERLHALYATAPREVRHIRPRDLGLKRVGHFGFFRPHPNDVLWQEAERWLSAQVAT